MNSGYREGRITRNGKECPFEAFKYEYYEVGKIGCWMHFHSYIELLYVNEGSMDVLLNGVHYTTKKGDLIVINSNDAHKIVSASDYLCYYGVKFEPWVLLPSNCEPEEIDYILPFTVSTEKNPHIIAGSTLCNDMGEIIERIYNEWRKAEYGYMFAMRSELLRVFTLICRFWNKNSDRRLPSASSQLTARIKYAVDIIANDFVDVDEREVAKQCNISYTYFSRSFKLVMGMSFKDYVNLMRINKAQEMLVNDNKSVVEIAADLGFSSSSHFINTFQKYKSMTPNQFKKAFTDRTV